MKKIKVKRFSIHLYCDNEFIIKMSELKNIPIIDEIFFSQSGSIISVDMCFNSIEDEDRIDIQKDKIKILWSADILSIIQLNAKTLENKGFLYTTELNYVLSPNNDQISIYVMPLLDCNF